MRILVQRPADPGEDNPVPPEFTDLLQLAARCRRPDTELIFNPTVGVDLSDMSTAANLSARFAQDAAILRSLRAAVIPGIDGAIVHCYFDPALWAAREALQIPVVGAAEASMTLASYVGRRFAVLTVSPRYVRAMEDTIDLYGRQGHAISYRPVRSIDADEACSMRWWQEGRLDLLVDAVTPVARACIADGADVLIVGCGLVSVLLTEGAGVTQIDGVPIITPIAAAVKAIELMADLQHAGMPIKSSVGHWGSQ